MSAAHVKPNTNHPWFRIGHKKESEPAEVASADANESSRLAVTKALCGPLTAHQFMEQYVNADKSVVVAFEAEWCSHCNNLRPIMIEASKANLATHLPLVQVILNYSDFEKEGHKMNLNGKYEEELTTMFQVVGYPTIVKVCGKVVEQSFEGERTKEALVAFAKKPPPRRV